MIPRRVVPTGLIVVAWVLAAGCASREEESSVTSRRVQEVTGPQALNPVALPDLSPVSESVRRQVRERYASFTQKLENRSTPRVELAGAYGELGHLLVAAKFSDEAELCYLHAQALMPGDVRWPYYLGHVYLVKGEQARAAASFERALELQPTDLPTLVRLADTYLNDGRPEAAEPIFVKALSLHPRSAAALFGAGRAALARQAYAAAVQYLEQALSIDERASAVHYPLAMAYRGLGDRRKAEDHMRQRGDSWPDLPDPLMPPYDELIESVVIYERRGVQALSDRDWAAAAAAFRRGLELEPGDASLRHRLGTALYAAGDVPGAVREFEEVARRSPDFAKAHLSLGVIHELNGRHAEAIERLSAAVKSDPGFPEARLALAEALRVTGQLQASLPHYEQAVKLNPGVGEAWIGGAMALLQLKRYQQAREWLSEARHVHPDRPELADLLARLP